MASVGSNALSKLLGGVLPSLTMLLTVPVLIHGLGQSSYGLLVVISSLTGYLSILDINLTASSIKFLAEAQARRDGDLAKQVLSFCLAFYGAIGLGGALLMYFCAGPLVHWLVDPSLYAFADARRVVQISAIGFALGQLFSFLLSVPQALQRYDLSSKIEVANGVLVPLATAGMVLLGGQLLSVVWLRNLASLLCCVALTALVRRLIGEWTFRWPRPALRKQMLGFSGFAYLSRLASLSYQQSDKLILAAVLGVKLVVYYAVPVMLANRVLGSTYRLTQVIFPISSALLAQGRIEAVRDLLLENTRYVFAINAAAVSLIALLARWFLTAWLGRDFAEQGQLILILVAVDALIDSLTNAASLVTDGSGRTRVTGLFAISRASVGLLGLYVGAKLGGALGVVISMLLVSCVATAAFLRFFSRHVVPVPAATFLRVSILPGLGLAAIGLTVGGTVMFALRGVGMGPGLAPLVAGAASTLVMAAGFWLGVVSAEHRQRLVLRFRR